MKISTNYYSNNGEYNNKRNRNCSFGRVSLKFKEDIPNLKHCDRLVILAHPDDETCFFSFINKFIKDSTKKLQLVYLTSGQKGRDERGIIPRFDKRMRDQRLKELEDSMNVMDVTREDPLVLDLVDGETHYKENRPIVMELLSRVLEKTMPDEVYSFDESGVTGHTDHIIASNMTRKTVEKFQSLKNIDLYQVGFTQESVDNIIEATKDSTQIFLYCRPSIEVPDRTIDITEEIPVTIESFSKYTSQFTSKACKALNLYFQQNPLIYLKKVDSKGNTNERNIS